MIYEWKCKACGKRTDVERTVADCKVPPERECCVGAGWARVFSSSTPYEHLKNAGIFPNQYGDIPPRKMD